MRPDGAGQITRHLLDVLEVLESHSVPAAAIGAIAAAAHGFIRATQDADAIIWLGATPGMDISLLLPILREQGWTVEWRQPDDLDEVRGVIQVSDKFGNVADLLLGIRGMSREAFRRIRKFAFEDGQLPVVSVEDFIAMKLAAGSRKDCEDAEYAYLANRASINRTLLEQIAAGFGSQTRTRLAELQSRVAGSGSNDSGT